MSKRADYEGLSNVPDSTLGSLREALVTKRLRTPITRAGLLDLGISHQLKALEAVLSGHSTLACLAVLDVVMAERDAIRRPAPELVWSGPERTNATARDTAVVLRELFETAERQVVIAGYDFTHGSSLLEPLWVAMRDRGVDVHLFLHIKQPELTVPNETAYGDEKARENMASIWPFGNPLPMVYYDIRACKPRPWFNMHAKCVVIDGKVALITSANFTKRAQEQNTECGVLIHDSIFAHHLARQWMGLIEAGLVLRARIDH